MAERLNEILAVQGFACEHWTPERVHDLFRDCPGATVRRKLIGAHVYLRHPDRLRPAEKG